MADPTRADCPLIYVNPAFEKLTQYWAEEALHQNCRFLQGPNTQAEDVEKIREFMREGIFASSCVLNYRKDGTPFHNLLFIDTLRGTDPQPLLMGCQFEFEPTIDLQSVSDRLSSIATVSGLLQKHHRIRKDALTHRARAAMLMTDAYLTRHRDIWMC